MKHIYSFWLLIVFFMTGSHYASAQWGWGGQSAYEAGQAWARNMQAQNNAAYKSGQAYGALLKAKWDIANANYNDAFQGLVKADEMYTEVNGYGSPEAIELLGFCFELGMGTGVNQDKALKNYKWAANKGYMDAQYTLQRINTSGWLTANNNTRASFSNFMRAILQGQANMGLSNLGCGSSSSSSSSSNSSSNGQQCRGCNGTGNCTLCHGEGHYWAQTGTYIGEDIREYVDCPACRATGKCQVCHGHGVIR